MKTKIKGDRFKREARERIFAREYSIDLNGTRAAIAAGYSPATAGVKAAQLLAKVSVKQLVAKLAQQRCERLDITAEKVLAEIAKLGFSNMLDYMRVDDDGEAHLDLSLLTREQAAAIQEIREDSTGGTGDGERKRILRTTFKLADKGINLERLGRHLKLFTDVVKVEGLEQLAERMNQVRKRKNGDGNTAD